MIPIPTIHLSIISRKALSRFLGVSFLESSISSVKTVVFNMHAPATTGPARGPRPASSTPAINKKPELFRFLSWRSNCLDALRVRDLFVNFRLFSDFAFQIIELRAVNIAFFHYLYLVDRR